MLNHTLERVTEKIASQPFVKTALLTQIEEKTNIQMLCAMPQRLRLFCRTL